MRQPIEVASTLKLGERPKVLATVLTSGSPPQEAADGGSRRPLELTIAPGGTISAVVRVERTAGFDDRIPFGGADAGRNLPHGVYVDNIGLNGLMITRGKTEQEFFITADDWVPETTRAFYLRAEVEGNITSWPIVLHVRSAN